jgi:hypothetical protein
MPWPAFNEFGDLPVGVYRATLAEVVAHFGHGAAQRIAITARLEHIYELWRVVQVFYSASSSLGATLPLHPTRTM